jgi:hypothetical protein
MKKIWQQITALTAGTASLLTVLAHTIPAQAATYSLSWQGNSGYYLTGSFKFDDQYLGTTITRDQLSSFKLSFFAPNNNLLQTFNYSFPETGEFTFNFDTVTGNILQSGLAPAPTAFDLGINNILGLETGLDFYTCFDPSGNCPYVPTPSGTFQGIVLQNNLVPQACFDVNSPDCVQLDRGGILTATRVPESSSWSALIALGLAGLFMKRKSLSFQRLKLGYQVK